jgi:small subunit ribosomal protein S3
MGQKIHPIGLRLNITQRHRSNWHAPTKDYPRLVLEDKAIREYLFKRYPKAEISEIFISRNDLFAPQNKKEHLVCVRIYAGRGYEIAPKFKMRVPAYKMSEKIKQKKKHLDRVNKLMRKELCMDLIKMHGPRDERLGKLIFRVSLRPLENGLTQASSIAYEMIEKLEKRRPFRSVLKRCFFKAKGCKIPGIKIQLSGRLNGAEIARTEWIRHGQVPLHNLRANLDYCYKTASTMYGILGIKVWTFKKNQIWNYAKKDPYGAHLVKLRRLRLLRYKIKHRLMGRNLRYKIKHRLMGRNGPPIRLGPKP